MKSGSKTQSVARPQSGRGGFTVIELLLTLGLMMLLGGLMVVNSEGLLSGLGERPPDEVLQLAVREARYQAALTKARVFLHFDEETVTFQIADRDNQPIASLPTGLDPKESGLKVRWFHRLPSSGAVVQVTRPERVEVKSVSFNPDRSSLPFDVEIEWNGERSEHRYDPFSDSELPDER